MTSLRVAVYCLAGAILLVVTGTARAEEGLALRVASLDQDGANVGPPPRPIVRPAITAEQFNAFAELIGEPRPLVWQRLEQDPGLVPFAVAAGNARLERRSSGKSQTAVGFSIFGVGAMAGYFIMLSGIAETCSAYDDSCEDEMFHRFLIGLVVIGASAGVGLGVGIPGIVSMVRPSEQERTAVDRYQFPQLHVPPQTFVPGYSALPSARTFKLPLLSVSF
jgi:hypothetical protein